MKYKCDHGMKNILNFVNFLKNNIMLPQNAAKATKTTLLAGLNAVAKLPLYLTQNWQFSTSARIATNDFFGNPPFERLDID